MVTLKICIFFIDFKLTIRPTLLPIGEFPLPCSRKIISLGDYPDIISNDCFESAVGIYILFKI